MDVGLMLAGGGGLTIDDLAGLAVEAEDAGLDGVYLAEAWRSGFVTLAAIAARTARIRIGPYVLNAHARSPLFTGISAVDLDELAGGRLVLGIGSGNRVTNEQYQGIAVHRPLAKMRDYIEIVRRVVTARGGQELSYAGPVHSGTHWRSQVTPVRQNIPIVLAATSPRMTQLAAELADGVAFGTLLSAELAAKTANECRTISSNRGFRVMMPVFVSVSDDREEARNSARMAVVNLYAGKPHPHYDRLLRRQGFAATADQLQRLTDVGETELARQAVPDDLLDTLVVAGTPADCRRRIAEYDAVDEMLLVNVRGMYYHTDPSRPFPDPAGLLASYQPVFDLARTTSPLAERTS